jgi:hypothetical protein
MLEQNDLDTITKLLVENIEIIEFKQRLTSEFTYNLLKVESIIRNSYILPEEITLILKLKILSEFCSREAELLDIIKKIIINLLEITEFKTMINDDYGISKEGYWSFRKDFRNKELEIMDLEYEFYTTKGDLAGMDGLKKFDRIALKFKKSMDKTARRGWL